MYGCDTNDTRRFNERVGVGLRPDLWAIMYFCDSNERPAETKMWRQRKSFWLNSFFPLLFIQWRRWECDTTVAAGRCLRVTKCDRLTLTHLWTRSCRWLSVEYVWGMSGLMAVKNNSWTRTSRKNQMEWNPLITYEKKKWNGYTTMSDDSVRLDFCVWNIFRIVCLLPWIEPWNLLIRRVTRAQQIGCWPTINGRLISKFRVELLVKCRRQRKWWYKCQRDRIKHVSGDFSMVFHVIFIKCKKGSAHSCVSIVDCSVHLWKSISWHTLSTPLENSTHRFTWPHKPFSRFRRSHWLQRGNSDVFICME